MRARIGNQAAALQAYGRETAPLREMAGLVESGDSANVEARAAREYWGRLLPKFVREDKGGLRNMLLNDGYAVVRAGVARVLVAYGLLPAFGVHHESAVNAFNLADDLLELRIPAKAATYSNRIAARLASSRRSVLVMSQGGSPDQASVRCLDQYCSKVSINDSSYRTLIASIAA